MIGLPQIKITSKTILIVFSPENRRDLSHLSLGDLSKNSTKVLPPLEFGGRCRASDGGGCFNLVDSNFHRSW